MFVGKHVHFSLGGWWFAAAEKAHIVQDCPGWRSVASSGFTTAAPQEQKKTGPSTSNENSNYAVLRQTFINSWMAAHLAGCGCNVMKSA